MYSVQTLTTVAMIAEQVSHTILQLGVNDAVYSASYLQFHIAGENTSV